MLLILIDLTTYRLKYQFDNKLYNWVRSLLKIVPLFFIIISIWTLGNTNYLPNNLFADDVVIRQKTDPNQVFIESVSNGHMFNDERYISNVKIPVDHYTNIGYI